MFSEKERKYDVTKNLSYGFIEEVTVGGNLLSCHPNGFGTLVGGAPGIYEHVLYGMLQKYSLVTPKKRKTSVLVKDKSLDVSCEVKKCAGMKCCSYNSSRQVSTN